MDNKKQKVQNGNIKLFAIQILICIALIAGSAVLQRIDHNTFDIVYKTFKEKISDQIVILGKIGPAVQKNNSNTTHGITAPDVVLTVPLTNPVETGSITSNFGVREDPISHENKNHFGLDIGANMGEKIHAALSGIVDETGENDTLGKYIRLDHKNGIKTLYAHCNEITVQKGATIQKNQVIASIGNTGKSTGPHLHFEFSINDIKYDPLPLIVQNT